MTYAIELMLALIYKGIIFNSGGVVVSSGMISYEVSQTDDALSLSFFLMFIHLKVSPWLIFILSFKSIISVLNFLHLKFCGVQCSNPVLVKETLNEVLLSLVFRCCMHHNLFYQYLDFWSLICQSCCHTLLFFMVLVDWCFISIESETAEESPGSFLSGSCLFITPSISSLRSSPRLCTACWGSECEHGRTQSTVTSRSETSNDLWWNGERCLHCIVISSWAFLKIKIANRYWNE